jgi:hypothetical protein
MGTPTKTTTRNKKKTKTRKQKSHHNVVQCAKNTAVFQASKSFFPFTKCRWSNFTTILPILLWKQEWSTLGEDVHLGLRLSSD